MWGIELEKRKSKPFWVELSLSVFSVLVALLITAPFLYSQGVNPFKAYRVLFSGAFGSIGSLEDTIVVFIPLLLVGIGKAVAFKTEAWNIGGPGQMALGAIAATWIALFLPFNLPPTLTIFLMFITGFLAGAGLAILCTLLKIKFNLSLVFGTLLTNYIVFEFLDYLLFGPWQNPDLGFPYTESFPKALWLPTIPGTNIHYPTLLIGLTAVGVLWVLLKKTKLGFEIKVHGDNPDAAKYAGMNISRILATVMLISGGLAGIAGVGEVAGVYHMLQRGVTGSGQVYMPSYGYIAIIVAWLGRRTVLGSAISAFFISGLLAGGRKLSLLEIPYPAVLMVVGMILLTLTAVSFFSRYKLVKKDED